MTTNKYRMKKIVQRLKRHGLIRTFLFIIWRITPYKFRGYILSIVMKLFLPLLPKHVYLTVNQTKIFIRPEDRWVFYNYFIYGEHDEYEISFVRKHIPRHYSFIDVGANFGAWTFSLADHFVQNITTVPTLIK